MASLLSLQGIRDVRDYVASWTWTPSVRIARAAALAILCRIENGQLQIVDTDGYVVAYGKRKDESSPVVALRVLNDIFWLRLILAADMGFAESYMLGEVTCSNLTAFFKIFILNRNVLSNGSTVTSKLSTTLSNLLRRSNTLSTARLNIAAHYDISNAMFAAFLSPDMTYSCAIWSPKASPQIPTETLEDAQLRKLDRIIDLARLKSSDHVLEIGTGWGSFAIAAVKRSGCKVTSLTLSTEQKELAEERIAEAGLSHRIKVELCDYRDKQVPNEGPFDKVVSIEMLEAVGREWLETYFRCIDRLLKKDGGIGVFQCITIPEARYEAYSKSDDFIRRYIFPGGHLPTVAQLVSSLNSGSEGTLTVDTIDNIGGHYAKTLRHWQESFDANFDGAIAPALTAEHPNMTLKDTEVFRRKWDYYFSYCEAGFATKTLGDVIFSVSREGAVEVLEDISL